MFYISDATSGGLYLSQAGEEQVQFSFGILSSKSLPHFQVRATLLHGKALFQSYVV